MVERASRTRTRTREVEKTTHESVATVYSSGVGVGEEKRKVIEVRQFVTEPAYVRVNAGVTKNLGNYESLRIDVSVSVPCYVEEVAQVEKRVAAMVADMLDAEVDEYVGNEEGK